MFVRLRTSQAYIPSFFHILYLWEEKWKLIENLDLCCPCQRKRKRVERGREYAPWKVRITAKAARWRQAKTRRSPATARRRNVRFLCKETADRGLNGHFEAETPCQVKLKKPVQLLIFAPIFLLTNKINCSRTCVTSDPVIIKTHEYIVFCWKSIRAKQFFVGTQFRLSSKNNFFTTKSWKVLNIFQNFQRKTNREKSSNETFCTPRNRTPKSFLVDNYGAKAVGNQKKWHQ